MSLHALGDALTDHLAQYGEAQSWFLESLSISRRLGDKWMIASTLRDMGEALLLDGNSKEARERFGESLGLFKDMGARAMINGLLYFHGRVAKHEGNRRLAARFFGFVAARRGALAHSDDRDRVEHDIAITEGIDTEDPELAAEWRHGRTMTQDQAVDCTLEDSNDS